MKKIIPLLFLVVSTTILAQSSWKKINSKNALSKQKIITRKLQPEKFILYNLSVKNFKSNLSIKSKNALTTIALPDKDGNLTKFSVKETPILANGLAEKFPSVKTYTAKGIDDTTATAKITLGSDGVHIIIFSAKNSTLYIDPYNQKRTSYIAYERKNLSQKASKFGCLFNKYKHKEHSLKKKLHQRNAYDGKLRTYRIAIACTAEYSQYHLKDQNISTSATEQVKKTAIISAINTTLARVNGIYEKELSVKLELVNNNDKIIFFDTKNDGFTNNSVNSLISESQKICDNNIGNANYDIGHTFSTSGGGLAGLGVVCVSGEKARGTTGTSQPKNDPYDIDYVTHEIGHQFGAYHTFNNSCENNRSNANAFEPGSGSTIMGYAGICSPNVQRSSSDYFHTASIASIRNTIQNRANCASKSNTNNIAPIANAGIDVFVPKSTPLVLKGIASDADSSNLTHSWEQIDNEIATMPPLSTSLAGPMFRSLPPSVSPNRYLPALATVINGKTASTWEVIPSVARTMNFAYTVRDNKPNGGATARDDKKITVTNAQPFVVTSQNTSETWNTGVTQVITWNKSTTNQAPINCTNVRIKLSTDGGVTFPITLVESTPNDGKHKLIAPNYPTNSARIMIEALDNIFYNVNSTNFIIKKTNQASFNITNTTDKITICNENKSIVFDLTIDYINGFNQQVNLDVTGLPSGTTATFSPSSISKTGNVKMTLTNFANATPKEYTVVVKGTSTSLSKTANATFRVYNNLFSNITLTTPVTNAKNISLLPTLKWDKDPNATSYSIKIATDKNFKNIVETGTSNINSYNVLKNLEFTTTYYWAVKAKNNCSEGKRSDVSTFSTSKCKTCTSSGNDEFKTSITNVTLNKLNNSSTKNKGYEDFTNIKINLIRGQKYKLAVKINTAGNFKILTKAWIDWNHNCTFEANEEYDLGAVTDVKGKATGNSPLSITVPENAELGNTLMRISAKYSDPKETTYATACEKDFDGEVEDYTITLEDKLATNEDLFKDLNLYPTISDGKINLNFRVKDKKLIITRLFDLTGRLINSQEFSTATSRFSKEISFEGLSSELYILQIENAGQTAVRKIIIR